MAEILLSGVLGKLAAFTVEEVLKLCGFDEAMVKLRALFPKTAQEVENLIGEVNKLTYQLSNIQTFIKDADKKRIVDETKKKWVTDLIEITYRIEDSLDNFLSECPSPESNKSLLKNISKLSFFGDFQKEMKSINEKISKIDEYRMRYNINLLGDEMRGQNTQSGSGYKVDLLIDPEVVGFDEDIKNVLQNLCDPNCKRLATVSIVGPGGIGKTTLAWKVYHSTQVRADFGKPAWVTIGQKYDFFEVLLKIAKDFDIEFTGLDANTLANKIEAHLKKEKYLIVLDDVWTKELCDELLMKGVLPNTNNGSRVLITTRLVKDVAENADTTYEPYQLQFLNDEQSLELLLKNAIPKRHQPSEGLTPDLDLSDLEDLPKEFIKKCMGLPLALTVLARLLRTSNSFNYHSWKTLLDTMSWENDGIKCSQVIATSYDHLPFANKFCFMYFAALPEDQDIEVQSLLRMWITEGLIPLKEAGRTMEDTAKYFLEDLVQRSMVQVSDRYPDGSIKYIRVHCIMRDLAIQKAKENKFLVVCSNQNDWTLTEKKAARRLAVYYSNFNEFMKQCESPNLRTLLIFPESDIMEYCSNYKQLRVLRVLGDINKVGKLQSFKQLPHLKYVQLNSFGKYIHWIESSSQENKKPGFWKWMKAMKSQRNKAHDFGKWIKGVEYLSMSGDIQMQMFREIFPYFEKLKHLVIKTTHKGCTELKDGMLPPNLTELHLHGFEFNLDPMPVLEKLGSLKMLTIESSNISHPLTISCSAEGFKQLKKLTLDNIQMLQEWKFKPGAMPLLEFLNVSKCDKLSIPQELSRFRRPMTFAMVYGSSSTAHVAM